MSLLHCNVQSVSGWSPSSQAPVPCWWQPSPLGPAVVTPSGQCAKGSGEQRVQGWEPGEQLLRERELEPDKCVRLVKEETQMLDLVWDYCKSIRLCGKVRP